MPAQWTTERHDLLESTNATAADRIRTALARNGPIPANLVVTASHQSAGRGQHGRDWQSPPGGLYLSAIVTDIPTDLRSKLALAAGVAIANTLQPLAPAPHIISLRWPNDVLLDQKKVAGVLCESVAMAEHFAAIIGVGINVNTHLAAFPPALRDRATSLAETLHETFNLHQIETVLLQNLAATLDDLRANGLSAALTRARELDSLNGSSIEFQVGPESLRGRAAGIDDEGNLLVTTQHAVGPLTLSYATATLISINGSALRM